MSETCDFVDHGGRSLANLKADVDALVGEKQHCYDIINGQAEEISSLREIIRQSIKAIGGVAEVGVSAQFMAHLPAEITAKLAALQATCARCESRSLAEGTIWCAACLEWYREEYAQHSPCAQEKLLTERLLASERAVREAEAEIVVLREALAPFANHQQERLRADRTKVIQYSPLHDFQWRMALDAYTATQFSVELTWESIAEILSLLQDGLISRRKAHEAINEVLAGSTPNLPTAGEAEFGQDEMPGEVLRGLRAERDALKVEIARLKQENEDGKSRLLSGQFDHCCGLSGFGIGRDGMGDVCPMCRVQRAESERSALKVEVTARDVRIAVLERALVLIVETCNHNLVDGPGLCNDPCAPCIADKALCPDLYPEESPNV